MTECRVCGRTLRNDESVAAGVGPKCRHVEEVIPLPTWDQQRLVMREEEHRSYGYDGDYTEVFRFSSMPLVQIVQLRRDLLDALSAGNTKLCLNYVEREQREADAILKAIDRVNAYCSVGVPFFAMLAVVGIEHILKGKAANNAPNAS